LRFIVFDRRLDEARFGPLWLASPEIAKTLVAAIRKGQDELEQYTLHAFVVMANHVHLLIEPRIDIARIMKGIRSFLRSSTLLRAAPGTDRSVCATGRSSTGALACAQL
jgi:REP element-mobilizing transposase RayT